MTVRLADITMTRNAGWSKSLTLYTDKARTVPLPLTGYTVKAQLRAGESSTSALLADITAAIPTPANGTIDLSLARTVIAAITADSGWFDVLVAPAGSDPKRLCYTQVHIADGETVWP